MLNPGLDDDQSNRAEFVCCGSTLVKLIIEFRQERKIRHKNATF